MENKFYKVEINIINHEHFAEKYNVPIDYKQYFYINYVTQEEYMILPDGSRADNYIYDYHHTGDKHFEENRALFTACSLHVLKYHRKEYEEGKKYAKEHNIPPAKWLQDLHKEEQEQKEKEYKSDDYIVFIKDSINELIELDMTLDIDKTHLNLTIMDESNNKNTDKAMIQSWKNDLNDVSILEHMFNNHRENNILRLNMNNLKTIGGGNKK